MVNGRRLLHTTMLQEAVQMEKVGGGSNLTGQPHFATMYINRKELVTLVYYFWTLLEC